MPSFNLVDSPWIPVLDSNHQPATVSLETLFKEGSSLAAITGNNQLEGVAITNLAAAIIITSHGNPLDWIAEHYDQFDLFHPQTPFMQAASLKAAREYKKPIDTLTYDFSSPTGSFSSYDSATTTHTYTPAETALMLLVRNIFSVGGLMDSAGKTVGLKTRSALGSPWVNYPVILPVSDTVERTLDMMVAAALDAGGHRGELALSLGHDTDQLGVPVENPGVATLMAPLSRATLLIPDSDGNVTHCIVCEGRKYPDEVITPANMPLTTWQEGDKPGQWQRRKANLVRPAWRQLLDAYSETQPGVLHPGSAYPEGTQILMATMGAYTSRVDGVIADYTVMPVVDTQQIAWMRTAVELASWKIRKACTDIFTRPSADAMQYLAESEKQTSMTGFNMEVGYTMGVFLAGEITVEESIDRINRATSRVITQLVNTWRNTQPAIMAKVVGYGKPITLATIKEKAVS